MGPSAFIFHGTGGYPEENWFPWLKKKLEEKGYSVFAPQFPTPERPSLEAWLKVLENYPPIGKDSVLVGHSLGGIFLLKLLETLQFPVRVAAFVGTPIGVQPILNYEADKAFAGFDFKWDKIRTKAEHFLVFHSDNDPHVG